MGGLSCGKKEGGEGDKKRCQDAFRACGDSLGRSAQLIAKGSLQHCIIYEFQDQPVAERNHTLGLNTWTTIVNIMVIFFSPPVFRAFYLTLDQEGSCIPSLLIQPSLQTLWSSSQMRLK